MGRPDAPTADSDEPGRYEIRLKGHLENLWTDWFDGLTVIRADNGETLLTGLVADQAALHGVLKKVRDLGLPLLAVMLVAPRQEYGSDGEAGIDQHSSSKETDP